jgi:hypothetical protein
MAALSACGCAMFWVLKTPRMVDDNEVIANNKGRIQGGSTILVVDGIENDVDSNTNNKELLIVPVKVEDIPE